MAQSANTDTSEDLAPSIESGRTLPGPHSSPQVFATSSGDGVQASSVTLVDDGASELNQALSAVSTRLQTMTDAFASVVGQSTLSLQAPTTLPDFYGFQEDPITWVRTIESVANRYAWTDAVKRSMAEGRLRGAAQAWNLFEGRAYPTWSSWTAALLSAFENLPSAYDTRFMQMRSRQQAPDEDIAEYIYDKLWLLSTCNLTWASPAAKQYVIDGIHDSTHAVVLSVYALETAPDAFVRKASVLQDTARRRRAATTQPCATSQAPLMQCGSPSVGDASHCTSDGVQDKRQQMRYQSSTRPLVSIHVDGIGELTALVDTGAERSALLRRHAPANLHPWTQAPLRCLGGNVQPAGTIDLRLHTTAGTKHLRDVPVFDDLPADIILGADYVLSNDVQLNIEGGKVMLRSATSCAPPTESQRGEPSGRKTLSSVLEQHRALFADNYAQLPGTDLLEHRIPIDSHPPICVPMRRYAERERSVIAEQVSEMLAAGVIRPSCSPWAAPVVLVRKKNGTLRFCVDYRELNKHTIPDSYPLPRIDDTIDTVRNARFFSSLDLRAGYWQINVAEEDKFKTAFRTPSGLYEFNRMPFGLRTAPSTFQRAMNTVLGPLKDHGCVVYLDDILVVGTTEEEHLRNLDEVLERLYNAGFRLNREKCQFGLTAISYLGYSISEKGVQPLPERISAVTNFPTPTCIKQLQSFLGIASYLRKFVANFASTAAPLTDLLKKNMQFTWGQSQEWAFQSLKHQLTDCPILSHFNEDWTTEVHTDASQVGLGAVLVQRDPDGAEHVVAYASRKLSDAESHYHSNELECLAVVWSVDDKFRHYLLGRHFTVVTDNTAISWMFSKQHLKHKFARWIIRLQEYDYSVRHRAGTLNQVADALSRNPSGDDSSTMKEAWILFSQQDVTEAQRQDTDVAAIIASLANAQNSSKFVMRDATLYRRLWKNKWQVEEHLLVIPASLRPGILHVIHDTPEGGHIGQRATLKKVQERFWWPKMSKSVRDYVASCEICQRHKRLPGCQPGLLTPIPPPATIFHTVGIDHVGPLPTTAAGNRYILIAVDHLSKFVEVATVPSLAPSYVTRFLRDRFELRHGLPNKLISDRAPTFRSSELRAYLRHARVEHHYASAYHPQANGLTERANQTIQARLAPYCRNSKPGEADWDEHLQAAAYSMNTSLQNSAGTSPYEIVYGQLPRLNALNLNTPIRFGRSVARQTLCRNIREEARKSAARAQDVQKRHYDRRHRPAPQYQIGDEVWVQRGSRPPGKKLCAKFEGPFVITERLGKNTWRVRTLDQQVTLDRRRKNNFAVHVARLKKRVHRQI